MDGFRRAISHRLLDAERRAEASAETRRSSGHMSTALVLADRDEHVRSAMTDVYPQLSRGRQRSLSGSGVGAGYAAGKRADLGGTRIRGSRPALPH
jgi:hypothetical protein